VTVHIGIVTYNSLSDLPACLAALNAQTYPDVTMTVVDNASSDGCAAWVRANLPAVRVIENSENVGFGRAHNQAMAAVGDGDYYLALNPDAELAPGYIARLVAALERSDPAFGFAVGKLLLKDSDGAHTGRLYSAGHALTRSGYAFNIGYGLDDAPAFSAEREVFGAPGAAALYSGRLIWALQPHPQGDISDANGLTPPEVKTSVLPCKRSLPLPKSTKGTEKRTSRSFSPFSGLVFSVAGGFNLWRKMGDSHGETHGFFDPDIFLYGEDTDVDWRARRAGWRCLYVPTADASHRRSSPRPELNVLILGNRYLSAIKNSYPFDLWMLVIPLLILHCAARLAFTPRFGVLLIAHVIREWPRFWRKRGRAAVPRSEMLKWYRWSKAQPGVKGASVWRRAVNRLTPPR
jgi:GT2 family glycosyltransferase